MTNDRLRYRRSVNPHAQTLKEIAYEPTAQLAEHVTQRLLDISRDIGSHTLSEGVPDRGLVSDLANLLQDQGIPFAVIGGLAINVRGQPRGTVDLDVLVGRLPDASLKDPDYARRFNFYPSRSSTGTVQVIDHRVDGQVELLLADSPLRLQVIETATEESLLGVMVSVATAEALILLKLKAIASNPGRRAKDGSDIVSVALRNDLDLDPWRRYLTEVDQANLEGLLPR